MDVSNSLCICWGETETTYPTKGNQNSLNITLPVSYTSYFSIVTGLKGWSADTCVAWSSSLSTLVISVCNYQYGETHPIFAHWITIGY